MDHADAVPADRGNHDMLFHRCRFYRMSACQGACPPLKVAIISCGAFFMFSGSMVAIVTPMTTDGGLDWPAWDRLLDFHAREGTDGIVVAATPDESPVVVLDEIEDLTRRAVARCRGKVKVIVGSGTNSTAGTVALTRTLSRLGVGAGMLVDPDYKKTPQ